ncbi:TniB family NTP-binding protein [Thiobacillus denitrificans]|uniref:TniB family NTP-binding protein n=1 Tax=Thiobacillus denitrificans TaxID=36861 RepID=UPI0003A49C36|nr:TniB family NTP-binding protein [Thiobacillus denitrificans]
MTSNYLLPFQQRLLEQVETALDEIADGGNSQGILLIGASGSGKTHGLDVLAEGYPPTLENNQRITPCCRVAVTAQADAVATAASVLHQLGKPLQVSTRPNLKLLEPDMHRALRAHQVRILVFEEFHNALLASTPQLRGQIARFLKNLWNLHPEGSPLGWATPEPGRGDQRLVVIVSGTDELLKVFEKDAELGSRFGCVVMAEQVAFFPPVAFENFRNVYGSIAGRFGLSKRLSPEDDSTVARCMLASGPHLRKLEKLLQRMSTLASRLDGTKTDLELLAAAFDAVGGATGPSINPFKLTEAEVTAQVAKAIPRQRR